MVLFLGVFYNVLKHSVCMRERDKHAFPLHVISTRTME